MKYYRHEDGLPVAEDAGTTFYTINESDLLKYYDKSNNPILRYVVSENGFKAFDIDDLYGSRLIGDTLYLCVTDGNDITVRGEDVFPEDALEDYDISDLSGYIEDGNDKIIGRYLTAYELKPFDLNDVAYELMKGGTATFTDILTWANELDLLDDIL